MLDKIANIGRVLAESVRRLDDAVVEWVSEPLVEREICETNIDLLQLGLRPDGSEITPEYPQSKSYWDNSYADYKRTGAGNRYDTPERPFLTPNLGLSGDFYRSIHVETHSDGFEVTASDYKWESADPCKQSIHDRYGEVLGVTEEMLEQKARPEISKIIARDIKQQLQ